MHSFRDLHPPADHITKLSSYFSVAETLYDVLHDHEYRKTWDDRMIKVRPALILSLGPFSSFA